MKLKKTTISFSASEDSAAISANLILGIQIPASFGVTALTMIYCETVDGTYIPVYDETGTAIGVSGMDSANASFYDLSNVFPLALSKVDSLTCGYVKFRAGSSITKDIIVYTGEV